MGDEYKNTAWQTKVRRLLKQGLGVEDMVVHHGMNGDDVREEIRILRKEGELERIYG
jgi:hypothetical protein